jgi:hypothetical protein
LGLPASGSESDSEDIDSDSEHTESNAKDTVIDSGDSDSSSEDSHSSSKDYDSSSGDSDCSSEASDSSDDINMAGDADRAVTDYASSTDSFDSIDNADESGWDSWDEDDLYTYPDQSRPGTLRPRSSSELEGPDIQDQESFEFGDDAEGEDTGAVETPHVRTCDRSMSREASRSTSCTLSDRPDLNTRLRSLSLSDGGAAEASSPSGTHGSNATEGATISDTTASPAGEDTDSVDPPRGRTGDRLISRDASRSTSRTLSDRPDLSTRFRSLSLSNESPTIQPYSTSQPEDPHIPDQQLFKIEDDGETSIPSYTHGSNATDGATISNATRLPGGDDAGDDVETPRGRTRYRSTSHAASRYTSGTLSDRPDLNSSLSPSDQPHTNSPPCSGKQDLASDNESDCFYDVKEQPSGSDSNGTQDGEGNDDGIRTPRSMASAAVAKTANVKHDLSSDESDVLEAAANPAKRRKLKDNANRFYDAKEQPGNSDLEDTSDGEENDDGISTPRPMESTTSANITNVKHELSSEESDVLDAAAMRAKRRKFK